MSLHGSQDISILPFATKKKSTASMTSYTKVPTDPEKAPPTPTEEEEPVTYDDVMPYLGEFGPYQRRIYFLLCLPVISCALHKLAGVFLQARTQYRCRLPFENDTANFLDIEGASWANNMSLLWDDGISDWSRCFRRNNLTVDNSSTNGTIACDHWVYDTSIYKKTTFTEWNFVCDSLWLRALGDSLFMLGESIGSLIFGDLSDRYGRRPVFFMALVLQVLGGLSAALAPEYVTFIMARMIVGATAPGVSLVAYVIAIEMLGPSKRVLSTVVSQYFFTVGYLLNLLFAYFITDWRVLQFAISMPGVIFFTYWWFIPESMRWLIAKGKYDQAKVLLTKVAKHNGNTIPSELMDNLLKPPQVKHPEEEAKHERGTLLDLMRYPNLRKKSFIIFFLWFANNITYYGLSWNTSNLGGNDYLNYFISGFVEFPGVSILLFTVNRFGRKAPVCGCMLIGGTMLLLTLIVPDTHNWLMIAFVMIGKMVVTASYNGVYVFSAEQFPTVLRNIGIGCSSSFARLGGISASYINLLGDVWRPLPQIIFGALTLTGGLMALALPETLNKKLPDSIEECENFGKTIPKKKSENHKLIKMDKTSNANKNNSIQTKSTK